MTSDFVALDSHTVDKPTSEWMMYPARSGVVQPWRLSGGAEHPVQHGWLAVSDVVI